MPTPTPASIFKFQLSQQLAIKCSGEAGECISRAEHLVTDPQYLLRYKSAQGAAREEWWTESALIDATPATVFEAAPGALTPPAIGQSWPARGGIYAGLSRGIDGAPDQHLILCELKPDKDLDWSSAVDWAAAIDIDGLGDWSLPTRAESALLFANLRDQFEPRWYWTCEQYSRSYAWGQYFDDGYQDSLDKSYSGRARAVRRLVIQSLSHS